MWERYRSWRDAQLNRALVAVGGPCPAADALNDRAQEDVAVALRLSAAAAAAARLDVARVLDGRLRRTRDALESGAVTYPHARALVDAVTDFDDDVAREIERATLDDGPPFETLTGFRRRLARVVIAADPRTADRAHLQVVQSRKVVMWPEPHGMATVQATLTADEAITAMRALTGLAHLAKASGDDRPIDVRRADGFAGLFDAALADPRMPAGQRGRAAVGVTVDSATLAGLADHPGHLDGYGPIPPVLARRLAAGGDWHRLVTDPVTGALLDYGRRTYRPPAELMEFILARDRTCRYPTCSQPARDSDIDHAQPYDHTGGGRGGSTSAGNCGALHRRHHRQKTVGNTKLVSHPDGSTTWTTSTGHVIHNPAIDHCPEHTRHLARIRAEIAAQDQAQAAAMAEAEGQGEAEADQEKPDDAVAEHVRNADGAAANAHSRVADEADSEDTHSDTSSGSDPPPF